MEGRDCLAHLDPSERPLRYGYSRSVIQKTEADGTQDMIFFLFEWLQLIWKGEAALNLTCYEYSFFISHAYFSSLVSYLILRTGS